MAPPPNLAVAEGIHVGCYTAERSIVDVYRLRHLEGFELARAFPAAEPQLRADLELLL